MKLSDIDQKLDRRLVIALSQESDFFQFVQDYPGTVPASVFNDGNRNYLDVFFPKENTKEQHIQTLLRKFEAKERKESYVVRSRINNIKDMKVLNDLLSFPPVVLNGIDLSHGEMHFYIRYHSNFDRKVSELIGNYFNDGINTRVEWLGPSPGIIAILNMINSVYTLGLVSYEFEIDDMEREKFSWIAGDSLGEVENGLVEDGSFRSLVYCSTPVDNLPEGFHVISQKDHIYEVNIKSRFLMELRKIANDLPVIRLRYFVRKNDSQLRLSLLMPWNQTHEYYSAIYQASSRSGTQVVLKHVLPFSNIIIDEI